MEELIQRLVFRTLLLSRIMTGKKITIILSVFGVVVLGAIGVVGVSIYQSGFWRGPDVVFGDQHLKTAVSLIELHKTRFACYPKTISDLKYLGEWDRIHTQSISYFPNADQSKYCVEVARGWVGKPELNMPEEFWQGTGFESTLCIK